MKRTLFFAAGVVAAVPVVGNALWRRTSAEMERAIGSGLGGVSGTFTASQLANVPAPVARFFKRTLCDGQRIIRSARIRQTGEFFFNGAWRPMRVYQVFSAMPPAFMWDARISAAPFMPVYVRDSYVAQRATMRAEMLAVYPVVNQSGTPELNAGALLRYLGEAVWFPTRLVPGDGLTWKPVDDERAEATLTDGSTTVSLEFRFDDQGDLVELYSPGRFRDVNGTPVPTPWRVRALGQGVFGGIRMMTPAVVEWVLPDGPMPYWRGSIKEIIYEY